LTNGCAGEKIRRGRANRRRRTKWRMSNAQALIFVAAVVIAVAMLLLA
jgi:hypothetical protein